MSIVNAYVSAGLLFMVLFSVSCSNHAPFSDAGEDQFVEPNQLVKLVGENWDQDDDIVSQGWAQIYGQEVELIIISEAQVHFYAPVSVETQTLSFTFNTKDSKGSVNKDPIDIVVAPFTLTSNAGEDQSVQYNQLVTLTGQTTEYNELIESQNWYQSAGTQVQWADTVDNSASFYAPLVNEELAFSFEVVDTAGAIYTDSMTVEIKAISPLNDTGVLLCADYANANGGSTNHNHDVDCDLSLDAIDGDIVPATQDGHTGFDTNIANQQGFSFTKLDNEGVALEASATAFSCVKDNRTGLIWEGKTSDGGLHDQTSKFNWYETNSTINAANAGFENDDGDVCSDYDQLNSATFCNTSAFAARVNATALCGSTQWRLPTKSELLSLIDYSRTTPAINVDYFPNTDTFAFWTINNYADSGQEDLVWYVYLNDGSSSTTSKDGTNNIRLVTDALNF